MYTLEKVLRLKRDQNTQASFLDEAMTVRFLASGHILASILKLVSLPRLGPR